MDQSFGLSNSGFWQDVPDSVLQDVINQLDVGDGELFDSMMEDIPSTGAMEPPMFAENTNSIRTSTHNDSLPALFYTPSLTDVSSYTPTPHKYIDSTGTAKNSIAKIKELHAHQQTQLEKLRLLQIQLGSSGRQNIQELQMQQSALNDQIATELSTLRDFNKSIVLDPHELQLSRSLGQKLQTQQQEILLLARELAQPEAEGLSVLVIEDQPVPQVTFKGKSIDENFTVRLLSGASTKYSDISKVKAQLVSDERTWKTNKTLSNDEASMDITQRVAVFHHLKLEVSTRMTPVFLKFGLQVKLDSGVAPIIQSHPSYPLVVITNESQWCEAAGKLLVMDCFAGQPEIVWPQFANGLHHHFLKAISNSKQDSSIPVRCIKAHEFEFLHAKFFQRKETVNTQQVQRFWSWFGQTVQTLRFKRHISALWGTGVIYGLITKEECRIALENQEQGTFLIRFSESFAGLFAVAYVSDDPDEIVKHYLVKPDDIGSQKSLPDFLRQKPQFQYLYLLDVNTGTLCKYPKDTILMTFYSKTKGPDPEQSGYVLL